MPRERASLAPLGIPEPDATSRRHRSSRWRNSLRDNRANRVHTNQPIRPLPPGSKHRCQGLGPRAPISSEARGLRPEPTHRHKHSILMPHKQTHEALFAVPQPDATSAPRRPSHPSDSPRSSRTNRVLAPGTARAAPNPHEDAAREQLRGSPVGPAGERKASPGRHVGNPTGVTRFERPPAKPLSLDPREPGWRP